MRITEDIDIESFMALDAYEAALLNLTVAGDRAAYLYAEVPTPVMLGEVHDRDVVAVSPSSVDEHETVRQVLFTSPDGPRLLDLLYVDVSSGGASVARVPSHAQRRDKSKELPEAMLERYQENLADILGAWSSAVSGDGYLALLVEKGQWAGERYLPAPEAHAAATEKGWELSFAMPYGYGSTPSYSVPLESVLLVYRRRVA